MKSIFLDTSGLVALLSSKDKNHAAAERFWDWLLTQPMAVYLTDYIFDETYTALRSCLGHKVASGFGELVFESSALNLIFIDEGLLNAAWEVARKYSDKTYSFTDCTSFVVMERLALDAVFTFDRHFAQYGLTAKP
ncbi:MAG: PIN domain-containing protein [Actinobacteria bacterium]|nr:PIN domain-containing protein [Actinomycetota bacterium]